MAKPSFDYLKPHLWIKDNKLKKVYQLFVFFRKDAENQKIEVKQYKPPSYPNPMGYLEISAKKIANDGGEHYFYDFVEIPYAKRLKHENMIHVNIDHVHVNHGGSGTVHFPPPPTLP